MASKEEQVGLGHLILQMTIEVRYIKNVRIEEKANEHGMMHVRFLAAKKPESADVLRCQGSDVCLMTADGEMVFGGKCQTISLLNENEYTEVELTAVTASILTDQEPKTNTFQGTGKTLNSVLSAGIGSSALLSVDEDIPLPEMLSQEQETDWAFGRRIANQYRKQLFVNSKTTGCQIHVGDAPFQKKETGVILHYSVKRDVDKVRVIQGNVSPDASVFEYEETVLTVSDLTIGAGYAVDYRGRTQIVTKSRITCVQGLLQNEITLSNEEGLQPEAAKSVGMTGHSSILTGTVLQVDGTNVMVDFASPNDAPRWIPYANAVNNFFYCMPDVGDTVFVYYETGNSDRIVCLGSRHVNDSPDFARYKDKMLTANNRMIKFGDKTLNLVGNRSEFDGMGGEQAKIIFNDETGIEIQSTKDIEIRTTETGNITIQAVGEDFAGMDALREQFEQMYGEGEEKYEADGGSDGSFDALAYLNEKRWDALKQNVKDNLMAPLQIVGTLQELTGRIGGSDGTEETAEAEEAPQFEDGVIDLFGLTTVDFQVGGTSISFADGIIQIKANTYMQLGTDRSVTYEHLEDINYTWRDVILDVTQLALDIVGALPIPGVSTVANLANAGISLARGDYVGAAISAGTAALSLIPGANTAAAGGKLAATAATKAPKLMKAVGTVAKVVKAIKTGANALNDANALLNSGMAAWDVMTAIANGEFSLDDPECRQDLFSIMQGAQTAGSMRANKKGGDSDADARSRKKSDGDGGIREKTRAKLDEISANRCANGEPIDMVTGSYLIAQCDFMINDITGVYAVERTYESLLSGEDSPIGRGWTLSLFSSAVVYDDRVEIILPDNHTETFLKTAEGYRNRRNGTLRLALKAQGDGYLLREAATGLTRCYDSDGRQLYVMDRNGNQTVYRYAGSTLQKICFASGQYLEFQWQGNKVISIQDCIGRRVSYHYEGDFLTGAEMVNGGLEKYAYDTQGHITEVTDANGVTYVHNEYDQKGRVTRQLLSNGQEYILLYADDDRMNTYLVPANGKEIHYIYNKNRQLICTKYQDGTTEETGYDAWENRVFEKNRNGAEIHRKYDAYSHLIEERQPGGLTVSYEYDEDGNCIRMWDNTGLCSWYSYDAKGNLTGETEQIDSAIKRETAYEYDKHGRVTAFTDPNGNRETYEYTRGFWESGAFTTAAGNRYEHELDPAGRCVAASDGDGVSNYAYNHFDILCMATDPAGNTTKYIYDRVLDLVGVVRPNHYLPSGNGEKRESYVYDAFHNRLARTDETGAVFATPRDGEGNVKKEINPNAYDSRTKDGSGIGYQYDADDRNCKISYPDGGIERRWYDAAGNLIKLCRPEQYDAAADDGAGYMYEYDSMNRLVQITAPDGTVQKRYVYDLRGNIVKVIDAKGMLTGASDEERIGELYTYNYSGWLLESRRPVSEEDGEVRYQLIQYQYDKAGNRIRERRFCEYQTRESASGIVHTIDYAYDADDRLIRVSDCTGAVLEYQYDSRNRRIYEKQKINDHASRTLRYIYDAAGRLTELNRTADREGCGRWSVSVKYEYDRNGNNVRTLMPSGGEILREYDAVDRLVTERHLDQSSGIDNTTRFAYDKAGNLICITDNQGRKTQMEYDLMNREIKRTERDGSVTRQFYDKNGQLVKTIRPREYERAGDHGAGVQYTYDAQGNILTVIRADGTVQECNTYDTDGQLLHTEYGGDSSVSFRYDLGGRRTKAETGGGASQSYEYDAMGNITGVRDGAGNRTEYILDKWGRITEIRQADGSSEFYAYDYAGNMTRSTDGEGNTTTYEYNGINQPAVMTDPEGNQETYVYDAEERLCQKTDRNGIETRYAYNLYGNLLERRAGKPQKAAEFSARHSTERSMEHSTKLSAEHSTKMSAEYSTELSERYEYTAEGLLKSAIAQGMRYDYTYDVMDRLSAKRASGRTLLAFAYDKNGNLTRQTDVTGKVTEYRYDLSDRIAEVWDDGKQIAGYDYNADGTVKRLRCGSLYTEYAYDADRNLTGLKTMLGSQVLADNHYRYDGNGNRVEKRQKYGTTTYRYDSMNRLATVEYRGFAAVEAAGHAVVQGSGNATVAGTGHAAVEGAGHAAVERQDTMDVEHLGGMPNRREQLFYDKAGNRTKRICNGMEEQYQYDKRNRLTVYKKGGVSKEYEYDNAGNLIRDDKARYEYDVFNRNTKVETFNGNIQINRYDAEGLRHEMEENGKLVSFIFRGTEIAVEETKEDKIRYIRTGELLASDAECARTYYHYAADEMGSITHVVNSEEGNVLNHYEYDAWGNLTVCEEKAENRFRFNGQQYDPISQQYYLRARYYNPVIGRFTQEDSYREDGLNLYAYCRNNPVYYVDPSGNICDAAAERIRGKIADGTASKNERRKLAAYERNEARKRGEAPSEYYQDSKGKWHRPNGEYAKNVEVGKATQTKEKSDGIHGNSLKSTKQNHVYVIVDSNGNMVKVGISGQNLNKDGSSPRANPQVSNFNKKGMDTHSIIVEQGLTRRQALGLEQKITDKYAARNNGAMPSDYHKRPGPRVSTIGEYVNLYHESPNKSNKGRY